MAKRKMNEEEIKEGIGEEELDVDTLEVEDSDDEQFTGFAQEEENEMDEEELIAEYHKNKGNYEEQE